MKNNISFNSNLSKFGIGLFETIKIENEPIDFDLHMNRLYNSVKDLNIKIDVDKNILKEEVLMYIKNNNIKNKALRITLFDEGYNISIRDIIYNDKMYNEGFKLTISPIKRGDSIIYRHKTTNYFENIYTKEYAINNGFDDAIFLNIEDKILECSMCNIFFIKGNKIYTPKDELPILNGIMKKRIEDICIELNIEVVKKEIYINEINNFEFSFVTNSLMGAMKVKLIENTEYNNDNILFKKILSKLT
ncbi:aminotransferase class IV [Romboutsia ilealis]|uniref:aminotransferase class IV n=2 Tax=Romboutsia ilealis TaxID=1115758 RepID=UPI0025733795|nr:aminotransferase class IV [Romboutsia ilealis]